MNFLPRMNTSCVLKVFLAFAFHINHWGGGGGNRAFACDAMTGMLVYQDKRDSFERHTNMAASYLQGYKINVK